MVIDIRLRVWVNSGCAGRWIVRCGYTVQLDRKDGLIGNKDSHDIQGNCDQGTDRLFFRRRASNWFDLQQPDRCKSLGDYRCIYVRQRVDQPDNLNWWALHPNRGSNSGIRIAYPDRLRLIFLDIPICDWIPDMCTELDRHIPVRWKPCHLNIEDQISIHRYKCNNSGILFPGQQRIRNSFRNNLWMNLSIEDDGLLLLLRCCGYWWRNKSADEKRKASGRIQLKDKSNTNPNGQMRRSILDVQSSCQTGIDIDQDRHIFCHQTIVRLSKSTWWVCDHLYCYNSGSRNSNPPDSHC